jgi:L-aspartate oxidase
VNARWEADADVVVVGTGVAGLTAALEAQSLGLRVIAVSKTAVEDGNTRLAQGGVAVVLPGTEGDSVEQHAVDTLTAGAGLAEELAVRAILADGPSAVARLRRRGAAFDVDPTGEPARAREGGHTAFRVIHAGGDATGAEVERALVAAAAGDRLPVLERHCAVEVLLSERGTAAGLLALDQDGRPVALRAPAVVLASGGVGQLYAATTNSDVATGDGLSLALRAGAVAADLEFLQFHPTALFTGRGMRGRCPLVSEAVRGEGGVLLDATGARVMEGVHELGDLAPRDVVATAIARRMADLGGDHVLLDVSHMGADGFRRRFPTVHASCLEAGIDPSRQPIPVAPAAHYHCGGVLTDVDGRTTVPGLYAAGEVARTGLHGANRLASNSLLEGLVVGRRAARAIERDAPARQPAVMPAAALSAPALDRDVLQLAMSAAGGMSRDAAGMDAALSTLAAAASERPLRGRADVEDAALTLVARALLAAAAARRESRGCHRRSDHPEPRAEWRYSLTVVLDPAGRPAVGERLAARSA